jgi:hypothetical protein
MGWWAAIAKALPYVAGALGGGGGGSSSSSREDSRFKEALAKIQGLLPQGQVSNPVLDKATSYYDNVMSNDYSAISPVELERMYNSRATDLNKTFVKQENNLASRLATSGLTGSRLAAKRLSTQTNNNNQILANTYNNLQDQNLNYTMGNKSQAFAGATSLANAYNNQQNLTANQWMQYANLLKGNNTNTSNNSNSWLGAALANIDWGSLFKKS